MPLTIEWLHRIEHWQRVLWSLCYRPLGEVTFSGFTTLDHLTPEEALRRDFRPMPPGTPWGAKWEYGWFRTSITLPPEAEGQRVVARLYPTHLESLVWINGRAAGSFGWGHREVPLARAARAGETFDILLEAYAGHGHITVGDGPYPHGVESVPEPGPTQTTVQPSSFGIWREEVYQAALDFTTLFELCQRLDPNSLRAAEIAEALMDATMIIDPELPEAALLETVRAGRERMRPVLAKRNGPTMPTLHAFGHGHIDVAWLWPLQHTERKMAMTMLNQFLLFEEYPEHRFLQSQPHLYWMMEQRYPDIFQRIREAVRAGHIIADGGMWVEADTNLSGGESLIRQILHGRRYFREVLGVDSRILWLPDVFGYSGALPQILVGCGMEGFATQKITWAYNGGEPFPYNTFWWEGIDGTAIPAHIFTEYNSEMRPSAVLDRWNTRLKKTGIRSLIMAFGWGDGGGGPARDHLEFYRRVQDLEGLPRVRMSSPAEFFADLRSQGLPRERYVGELYFQAHRGTYTSQARTKRGNRKSEFALREAELWGSLARVVAGFDFGPRSLEEAWRRVLLNQFHDILPGSSIHRVYEEAEAAYAQVIAEAERWTAAALAALTGSGQGRTAFNSLPWPRRALVQGENGPVEVEVPACGWAAVPSQADPAPTDGARVALEPDGFVLENARIRARFDSLGQLVSLWDREAEREWMAAAGNVLTLYKDVPTKWDAWDVDSMVELMPVTGDDAAAQFEIVEDNPLVVAVRVRRTLNLSTVEQVIRLRRDSRRIDFATVVDWQESHKLLKVSFPVEVHTNEVISEIQFGHIRRPNHRSRQYDQDRFEICNHKWSALAEEGRGAAVLNDGKYGLSALGKRINLTLLKSAMAPDMTADKGIQTFTYALYTWNGPLIASDVLREAYDLNAPVQVVNAAPVALPAASGSFFRLDRDTVVVETVKPAEDGSGDIVLRLYEAMRTATRCTLEAFRDIREAWQTNLLEEEPTPLTADGPRLTLDFRPFEIKTVR
ncbi:MAG: glycoside hydrolase family 38 C-terminal domain-containing protein, partial [Anaerolineae bacterium]|nr:glycoside hydrolase family 38 C-terminal domain-containing protein [Anaerolineae bacterium]